MPRIHGTRERRHQPFWDSLIRQTGGAAVPGNTTIQPQTVLFGSNNVGQADLSNMQVAGQLAADQTFIIMALRCYMHFNGTNDITLFKQVSSQLNFLLSLGDKPMFQSAAWYLPAGGGHFGSSNKVASTVITNGYPSTDSILKLARPIVIPVRQNIAVTATFHAIGATSAVTTINTADADDEMSIQYLIDGIQTRDVQ